MVEKPKMREVPVREAIGMMLPHDMTQILPGEFKGRLFKKGHVVTEADIEPLLSIGKEHIYVLEMPEASFMKKRQAFGLPRPYPGKA